MKSNIESLVCPDSGTIVTDNKDKANILSNQFKSVFMLEGIEQIPKLPNVNLKKVIPSIVITEKLVLEKLKYLNTAKSVGPDDVHAMVLKTLSGVLC